MKKLFILLLIALIAGCGKSEEKVKNYLSNGKALFEKGNFDKARIEFKNVIQLDGKNAEAYYHIALIEEKKQNWQGMYANLIQTVKFDPKNLEAKLKLGRLHLLSNQIEDAQKEADEALKIDPKNPDALAFSGAVMVKRGQSDKAMAIADQILKDHPDHTDATSLKTVIQISKNDMSGALATLEKALQIKPNEPTLLVLKLEIHNKEKNFAAMEQDYQALIRSNPQNFDFTYALAKHYSDLGQLDKALSTLQALVDKNPDTIKPKLALLDFLFQKQPDLLEKHLNTYLAQLPEEPELLFRSIAMNMKQGKLEEAKSTLSKIIELKPNSKEERSAKVTLAKIAVQQNDMELAQNLNKQVLEEEPRNLEGSLLQAKFDLQKGLLDEAITNLRVVLRDYSKSDEAYVLIGQAYLKKNSPELAEENFRKALEINPANFDALVPVAAGLIKSKDILRAEELLQKALTVNPEHPAALQAMAQVKLMQKDWAGTQKMADIIASKPSGAGFAKFLSGKISENQGLYQEAIGQYKEAIKLTPELSDALRGMANCYFNLKQSKEMYAYLDEYMAAHPNDPYPWLLKGQLLDQEKRPDDAVMTLTSAIEKWPKNSDFYEGIARIYVGNKANDKALEIIQKGLAVMPDNLRLTLFLASTYEQVGEFEKALKTYEGVIAKNPDIDLAVNNTVSLLLDHFNTKENLERAVTLAKKFEKSEQPYFVDSYGWALYSNGKYDEALQVLREVVKKMPNVPVFRYHLGAAYLKTNNMALAKSELEEAIKLGKDSPDGFLEEKSAQELLKTIK